MSESTYEGGGCSCLVPAAALAVLVGLAAVALGYSAREAAMVAAASGAAALLALPTVALLCVFAGVLLAVGIVFVAVVGAAMEGR